MQNRILYIVLGIGLLIVGVIGVFTFFRKSGGNTTDTVAQATPTPSEAPLFGDNGNTDGDSLFSGTPNPNDINSGSTLTISSRGACPKDWENAIDNDNDTLPDSAETIYKTDANKADTDGDNYKDGEEVRNGYDPLKPGSAKLDSDLDNLNDDQECKWGTDPFSPDSDMDGYKDGDEVNNGYDPTKKGDGKGSDALPEKRAQLADQALRPNTNSSNYTEGLAGLMLGNRPMDQAGQTQFTTQQIQQTLANARLDTTLPTAKISELNIIQTNTKEDIAAYLAQIDRMRPSDILDTANLTNALMGAFYGNTQQLASIRANLSRYETTLLAISTPASAVQHQTLLVQVTRFLNNRLGVIETNGKTDPVKAYLAARELQEGLGINVAKLQGLRENLAALAQ